MAAIALQPGAVRSEGITADAFDRVRAGLAL
jgi:hypothetical protein